MTASIGGVVVADAPDADLIEIEGDSSFPPSSLTAGSLRDSATPCTCPWTGDAQDHDISAGGSTHRDAAWSHPRPYPACFDEAHVTIG